jgi:cytidylate kinase
VSNLKNSNFVIAIDGFSASGKGTLAKLLANYFGCKYLSTGNLYRLVAKEVINQNVSIDDVNMVVKIAENINLDDLELDLSDNIIANVASKVAQNLSLRKTLSIIQKSWVDSQEIAIIEGRDIGTVICPDADVKLFMTASIDARAHRRYIELQKKISQITYEDVYNDLRARDQRDQSREISPLIQAEDAFVLDSTNMSIDNVLESALSIIRNKLTIKSSKGT